MREPGFAANVELLLKLYNAGAQRRRGAHGERLGRRLGVSKMNLKPTVVAYGRLMAAHIVGRIQPPPISPLGELDTAPASARSRRPQGGA